jgi:phenazine biosynthesis protein phzE
VWCAGAAGDEVVALRGEGFASVQFHTESVLSPDGVDLLADVVADLLTADVLAVVSDRPGE